MYNNYGRAISNKPYHAKFTTKSNHTKPHGPYRLDIRRAIVLRAIPAYVLIFILGTCFNAVAIFVPLRNPHLRGNPFNILIINMAVVDMISCLSLPLNVYIIPYYLATGSVRNLPCYILVCVRSYTGLMYFSIATEMAIIRAVGISCNSFSRLRLSKYFLAAMIVSHSLAALLLTTYLALKQNLCSGFRDFGVHSVDLNSDETSYVFINAGAVVILFVIICSCYACIALLTHTNALNMANVTRNNSSINSHITKHNLSTIQSCVLTVTWYMLCHLPLIICVILIQNVPLSRTYITLCSFFALVSPRHLGNPVILFWSSKDFRKHVMLALRNLNFLQYDPIHSSLRLY